jgi:oligopeptide transport system substrate-binding protein
VGQVELSLYPESGWARGLEMYEDGRLDVVSLAGASPEETHRARHAHAAEYVPVFLGETFFLAFDATQPPFDDRRVRQAFALALDREAFAEKILGGYHLPATGGFLPPGMPGHAAGIALQYDAARGRQLLAEAGFPGGQGFPSVHMLTWPRHKPDIEYLCAQWGDALGAAIAWEVVEWADYLEKIQSDPPPTFVISWGADYPDPDTFLRVALRQHSGWRDPLYDQLVERASRTMDQQARIELYQQADRILVEQAVILPLSYTVEPLLIKPWVTKYPISANQVFYWRDVIIEPH